MQFFSFHELRQNLWANVNSKFEEELFIFKRRFYFTFLFVKIFTNPSLPLKNVSFKGRYCLESLQIYFGFLRSLTIWKEKRFQVRYLSIKVNILPKLDLGDASVCSFHRSVVVCKVIVISTWKWNTLFLSNERSSKWKKLFNTICKTGKIFHKNATFGTSLWLKVFFGKWCWKRTIIKISLSLFVMHPIFLFPWPKVFENFVY